MHVSHCPRCGCLGLEHLSTHAHCWECGYSPDSDRDLNMWRRLEFPYERPRARRNNSWSGHGKCSPDLGA